MLFAGRFNDFVAYFMRNQYPKVAAIVMLLEALNISVLADGIIFPSP